MTKYKVIYLFDGQIIKQEEISTILVPQTLSQLLLGKFAISVMAIGQADEQIRLINQDEIKKQMVKDLLTENTNETA